MRLCVTAMITIGINATISNPITAQAPAFSVPQGFKAETIASIERAREIAFAPNGDLFVGTLSGDVWIVPHPEREPGRAHVFTHVDDAPLAGVLVRDGALYLGSQHGIWRLLLRDGESHSSVTAQKIAAVRPGNAQTHITTSLAFANDRLFASVGSSCNACVETDPTRATIQEMNLDGHAMVSRVTGIRNAIALAVNPQTGAIWAAVAGQDDLARGHPYEIFDPFSLHHGPVSYGWPDCYENRRPTRPSVSCSNAAVPRVVFPAYETPIAAVFYPGGQRGNFAFPREFRGGAFVTLHGSWHVPLVAPRVVYVPMNGDEPTVPVNWDDPTVQWREFMGGFQNVMGYRSGRPTGIAVGPEGSLFVADDHAGAIYRVRPL